jgi:chaperonin GroES
MADKKLQIKDFIGESGQPLPNIADQFDADFIGKLGLKVVQEMDRDLGTMDEWIELTNKAMEIAKQVLTAKSFPWPDAANVKYPLITGAAIQFAARAYAEIIKGNDVVKGQVVGADPTGEKGKRSKRVSRHMSYQLLHQMTEWEPQTDQMLHMIPVVGTCFKKSYFCPLKGRNVSELVKAGPGGLIFDNKNTKDLETTRRVTHEFPLYGNDIKERITAELYLKDLDLSKLIPADADGEEQPPHSILEQHRWEDFDGDGYEEPYIVTVHKDTSTVLRVVPRYDADSVKVDEDGKVVRIEPTTYFTKYGFFPDPAGGFLDLGFGQILYPINESINTTLNQLLDAGTLANTQGGFVARGFRIKAGTFSIAPGEWKQIDVPPGEMKNSFLPLPAKEPSGVLFQLLGFLVEAGQRLANQTEVLQGEGQANTPATTTLALIEQGLKVYNSIYKRFYRSMKEELKKLARLNKIYLEDVEYFNVLDEETAVARTDYEDANVDVLPVADPAASTEVQRMARAQALMQILGDPLANKPYILKKYVDAIGEDPKQAILAAEAVQQPPDPKMEALKQKIAYDGVDLQIKEMVARSQIDLNESIRFVNIAKAEATEAGNQFEQYMGQMQQMHMATMQMMEAMQGMLSGQQPPPQGEIPQEAPQSIPEMEAPLPQPEAAPGMPGMSSDPAADGRMQANTDVAL